MKAIERKAIQDSPQVLRGSEEHLPRRESAIRQASDRSHGQCFTHARRSHARQGHTKGSLPLKRRTAG